MWITDSSDIFVKDATSASGPCCAQETASAAAASGGWSLRHPWASEFASASSVASSDCCWPPLSRCRRRLVLPKRPLRLWEQDAENETGESNWKPKRRRTLAKGGQNTESSFPSKFPFGWWRRRPRRPMADDDQIFWSYIPFLLYTQRASISLSRVRPRCYSNFAASQTLSKCRQERHAKCLGLPILPLRAAVTSHGSLWQPPSYYMCSSRLLSTGAA